MTDIRTKLFIAEALRWVGIQEEGNNGGQVIQLFQRAVDNRAEREPYCLAFVHYCLKWASYYHDTVTDTCNPWHEVFPTEHCLTMWRKTPERLRSDVPVQGSIVVWQHYKDGKATEQGHAGIVTSLKLDDGFFNTVEANTSPSEAVEREGDGVFSKTRSVKGTSNMKILGFILPWGPVS